MAQISLTVSTENESEIRAVGGNFDGCVMIELSTNILSCGEPYPYTRDTVTVHGTATDIRLFAESILKQLPAKVKEAA